MIIDKDNYNEKFNNNMCFWLYGYKFRIINLNIDKIVNTFINKKKIKKNNYLLRKF